MRLSDCIHPEGIILDFDHAFSQKQEAIEALMERMCQSDAVKDAKVYKEAVLQREQLMSTGFGRGIAIPHAKSGAVIKPGICLLISPGGIAYNSMDHQPVHLLILLAAPDNQENLHLEMLSRLSLLLREEALKKRLLSAETTQDVLNWFWEAENTL